MAQNQSFSVILSRMTGETEQRAIMEVTAKSKKLAGDIALGRAEEDDTKVEWTPRLPQDVTPGEDIYIHSVNGDEIDHPKTKKETQGEDEGEGEGAPPHPGTQSPVVGTPDLEGLGTFGVRVDGATGAHVNMTEAQLAAQKQGRQEDKPKPRATSDADLASAPGCSGVKAALNNPIPRMDGGGRVLDVNNDVTPKPASDGADTVTTSDVHQQQQAGMPATE